MGWNTKFVRIPKSDCSSWPEFERYQNAATIHWIQRASKSQSKYGDDEPTSKLWSIQQWCAERLPVPNANWDATWYAAAANFMNNGGGPFADPRPQQFSPIQQQPTGFQSSFGPPQQQFPQPTGINSFLPPPLQPQPTGMPQQQQQNGFSSFNPPPVPPILQQNTIAPLVPQKTGPPPPVRFGVTGDAKKLMPQATGRRANLSQATPQNPFGF